MHDGTDAACTYSCAVEMLCVESRKLTIVIAIIAHSCLVVTSHAFDCVYKFV